MSRNPNRNRFTMPRLVPPPRFRVEQRGRVYCVVNVASGNFVGTAKWTRQQAEDAAIAMNAWASGRAERQGA